MNRPHKHAEIIKAWADGAEIQIKRYNYDCGVYWYDLGNDESPIWLDEYDYRIKPEEKKPVVRWLWAYKYPKNGDKDWAISSVFMTEEVAMKHAAQEVKRLDWSRTEFEE